jgi:serine/threonine protein kinase
VFHPHNLQPGEVFAGDFRVERPLAMGGMGAVYVVEQLSTGRKRALKLLLPSLVENLRTRERFEQEARIASRIESDHVVEVVGAGVDAQSGAPWLAMELLDGETLADRVKRAGPLSQHEMLEVFRQMCHALAAAHAQGLVHRDIKPENLYLAVPRREGIPFTLKILDFGIAKLTADVRGSAGATGAVGSPMWMSPEQTGPGGVGPPADVWALGLVAFHCLTGRSYWMQANAEEATLHALLREVLMEPIEPASSRAQRLGVGHLIPQGFDPWFAQCVDREPSHRPPNAAQALQALGASLGAPMSLPTFQSAVGSYAPAMSRAPSFPELSHTAPNAVSTVLAHQSAAQQPKKSSALFWILGVLGVFLVGMVLLVLLGAGGAAFFLTRSASAIGPTSSDAGVVAVADASVAPTAETPVVAPDGAVTMVPVQPGKVGVLGSDASTSGSTGTSTTPNDSGAISMNDIDTTPKRVDYKLPWYKEKINGCWKGNEGAKPDAGSFSATVTVKLNKMGQSMSIGVNPKTHPNFTKCVVIRTSEHPWGHGPEETKSFNFSF